MKIQAFGEKIKELVETKTTEHEEVMFKEIVKSNDVIRHAIIIKDVKDQIAPTIYIDNYFMKFKSEEELDEVANEIINSYHKYKINGMMDMDYLCDYEKAKDNIFVKLVNKDKNEKSLNGAIKRDFLDLCAVVYFSFSNISDVRATTTVKKELLNMWNRTEDEVYEKAIYNTKEKLGCTIEDLASYFSPLVNSAAFDLEKTNLDLTHGFMYCMTNMIKHFGASCMMYEDKLNEFSKNIGRDLIVLPSSVHEILIIPAEKNIIEEEINSIIRQVNESAVDETEVLSDHFYYYETDYGFR